MEKGELVRMLSEGLSTEELPMISNLLELEELVKASNLNDPIKKRLLANIKTLTNDTIDHAKIFNSLIREVENGKIN